MILSIKQRIINLFSVVHCKIVFLLFSILSIMFFAILLDGLSQNYINKMRGEYLKSDTSLTIIGREYSNDEYEVIANLGEIQFQTHSFLFNMNHEVDGDFRVAAAKVIVVSGDYPMNDWIKTGEFSKLAKGDALLSPTFALKLGINLGDRFEIKSNEFVYVGELIGQPYGFLTNIKTPPNILINDSKLAGDLAAIDSNYINTTYLHTNADIETIKSELNKKFNLSDLSISKRVTKNIHQAALLENLKLLPEIAIALATICSILLLQNGINWMRFGFEQPERKELSFHVVWKFGICLGIAIIFASLFTAFLMNNIEPKITSLAFEISLGYFLILNLIVFIEVFFKSQIWLKSYFRVCQFMLIMTLFLAHSKLSTSLLIPSLTIVCIVVILMFSTIRSAFAKNIRAYFSGAQWAAFLVLVLCSVTLGLFLTGTHHLSQRQIEEPRVTISHLSERGIDQLSNILEEEGNTVPNVNNFLTAQLASINGHIIEDSFSIAEKNTFWMTISERAEPDLFINSGKWWDVFSKENYIAMEKSFAEELQLDIGDQLKIFINGRETLVILRAVFTAPTQANEQFTNIFVSSNILKEFPASHYVTLKYDQENTKDIITRVTKQIPEANLYLNISDIWASQVIGEKVDYWISRFSWSLAAIVIYIAVLTIITFPKFDFMPKWRVVTLTWKTCFKQVGPLVFRMIGFYMLSMILLQQIIYLGFGSLSYVRISPWSNNIWLGVGLFTLIIFTIMAMVQHFKDLYAKSDKQIADFS